MSINPERPSASGVAPGVWAALGNGCLAVNAAPIQADAANQWRRENRVDRPVKRLSRITFVLPNAIR